MSDTCSVTVKSVTFEMRVAWPGPVTVSWRMSERWMSPLKDSFNGAFMSAEP